MMAKYGAKAADKVERAMHEMKEGSLKIGRSDKPVKSRAQAIAIGLSEARQEGGKVPRNSTAKPAAKKTAAAKTVTKQTAKKKPAGKKTAARKAVAKKTAASKTAVRKTAAPRRAP